jgi:hypothetical protein
MKSQPELCYARQEEHINKKPQFISTMRKCRFLTITAQRMQGRRLKKYPLKRMQTLCNSSDKESV